MNHLIAQKFSGMRDIHRTSVTSQENLFNIYEFVVNIQSSKSTIASNSLFQFISSVILMNFNLIKVNLMRLSTPIRHNKRSLFQAGHPGAT